MQALVKEGHGYYNIVNSMTICMPQIEAAIKIFKPINEINNDNDKNINH